MTDLEAKAAFSEKCPIICAGITYQRICALTYREKRDDPGIMFQVELLDRNGNSVTITTPDRIERVDRAPKQERNKFEGISIKAEKRAVEIQEAAEAVMNTLTEYRTSLWGDILGSVVSELFTAKIDAAQIEREEAETRALLLAPGATVDLSGKKDAAAED